MKVGTWRVVVEGGAVGELTVDVVGGGWHRVSGQEYHPATPLRAAIAHAAWARDWAVVEIVAPGALTRAEALRDARDDLTACERLLAMTEETAEARDAELTAEVVRLRAAATTGGEGR